MIANNHEVLLSYTTGADGLARVDDVARAARVLVAVLVPESVQ